ncbi:glycerophosphodiester phosphodiesterase [Staphylococcus coagulans]|uniref:Glycerophosphodiester phosphodiesterase n=1 Tax=Staphylococcus coagulans TaxID=74706 RepID=A0ABU1F099_9STAP|nr:glycerophosphodiester phosphodiesterase [Staphylococcus coagulans]MDR5603568.1 glycerophosphodiester phosphodiesterase [Staphylococcus coagulans]
MTQSRRLITRTLLSITSLIGGAAFIKHYKKGSMHRQIPEFFQHPAPYIFSHRGGMAERPESTILAFDHSVEMNLTGFETDIRITKDEKVIVFHDADVNRTTNGSGYVRDHTLDELKSLDAGYRFKDMNGKKPYQNHPDAKIMTMDELLSRYPDQLVNIDIKDQPQSYEGQIAAQRLYETIKRNHAEKRVLVTSFYKVQIERFYAISRDEIALGASQAEVTDAILKLYLGLHAWYRGHAQTFQMPTYFHRIPLVQPKLINWLNQSHITPGYYGVNSVDAIHDLVEQGVHTIVTDRPTIGRQFLTAYRSNIQNSSHTSS